jgi:hypothetical protein
MQNRATGDHFRIQQSCGCQQTMEVTTVTICPIHHGRNRDAAIVCLNLRHANLVLAPAYAGSLLARRTISHLSKTGMGSQYKARQQGSESKALHSLTGTLDIQLKQSYANSSGN